MYNNYKKLLHKEGVFYEAISCYIYAIHAQILRARPELVEGYPRALEDILQQVQDERGKNH